MMVADAVQEYVVYKQALGMSYKGRALKLNAFARFVGPIDLDEVTPDMIRNFLNGHGTVTTDWFNKFPCSTHSSASLLRGAMPKKIRFPYETKEPTPVSPVHLLRRRSEENGPSG